MSNKKIALQGFSRVKMFPVLKNTASAYEVGEGFEIPHAQELTKDPDVSENKIYADDVLYMNMKAWNGINSTLTIAEMTLEMMAKLGFGSFDQKTNTLKMNPQGENKEYAMTFRSLRADGKFRMNKMYSFTVNEIKETATKTKGDGSEINSYQIIGTFASRKVDGIPGEIHDGDDLTWLESIEKVPKSN